MTSGLVRRRDRWNLPVTGRAPVAAEPEQVLGAAAAFEPAARTHRGVSLLSRLFRAFELRVNTVELDPTARQFITDCARRRIRLIAHESASRDAAEYRAKLAQIVADNDFPADSDVIFVEVTVTDPSDFETELRVTGAVLHGRYRVLRLSSSSVPNALAALLLHIRDLTHRRPHIYFEWTEGNPAGNFLRYLIFGQGEIAPVTREILRQQEPDRSRRPHVHAG